MSKKDTLLQKREEANQIVSQMSEQFRLIENNAKESSIKLNSVSVDIKGAKELSASLNRIISSSKTTIENFRKERDRVNQLLKQVNAFYTKKYQPLAAQISDKTSGLQSSISFAKATKAEITKLKTLSTEQYQAVKNYASDLSKKNQQLNVIDLKIRKLLDDSTNKSKTVTDLNKSVTELESSIATIAKEVSGLHQTCGEKATNISNLLNDAESELQSIQNIKEAGSALLIDIQSIYNIAAETGLSGEFDKRAETLKRELKKWEQRIFTFSGILFLMIVLMFALQLWLYNWNISNHTFDINFYVRFLIVSPVVYYLYFCSNQHSQTNMLFEKYNFKTTLAMSIKHHIQLLNQDERFTKVGIDRILDFVLEAFRKIYSEPHTTDDYKLKLKFANIQLDLEKKFTDTINKFLDSKLKLNGKASQSVTSDMLN